MDWQKTDLCTENWWQNYESSTYNIYRRLNSRHFGVLEPTSCNYYTGNIDLVITPSIVFDKNGYRLGYGKGYYDKYFATNKNKASIGLSYDKLLQEKVPTDKYDKKVDIIITEEQTLIINEKHNSND